MLAPAAPAGRRDPARRVPRATAPIAAAILAALGGLLTLAALAVFVGGPAWGFDFACYFEAAARLVHGAGIYQASLLAGPFTHGGVGTYVYAPPLAVLLAPLVGAGFPAATLAWLGIRLALLALAIRLLPVATPVRLATFGVTALGFPFLNDLNLGQVNLLLLAALAAGWRWLDRPAGAAATALGLFLRPQLAILLAWWAARRRWRLVAWALATAAGVVVLSLPFVGPGAWRDYLRLLENIRFAGAPHNGSLDAFAGALGLPEPLPTLALAAGAAVAVGAIALATRRDRELGFVVASTASLLLSPLLWAHYLVLLVLPAAFLAGRGRPWGLALPLLGWLPASLIWVAALAGTVAPLAVLRGRARAPAPEASPGVALA